MDSNPSVNSYFSAYASLYAKEGNASDRLLQLANRFSPDVEQVSSQEVAFSISPLRRLLGSPHQIVSEICRLGDELKLQASLSVAANLDTAILLARNLSGVTLVTPGEERLKLAPLPLRALFEYDQKLNPSMLEILLRWGVKTCEELSALPEKGVAERLGPTGVYLRHLASGSVVRPLRLSREQPPYEIQSELEDPLHLLEPLLFLLSRAAGELCQRLRSQSQAARELEANLDLESAPPYHCRLEFPVPVDDHRVLLKLLQLHLERHPPGAPVRKFRLRLEPVDPRRVQGGIFLPSTPSAGKLQTTLARIAAMVGEENVGTPVLENTHRPDAFTSVPLPGLSNQPVVSPGLAEETGAGTLRLAMRLFRPALRARVRMTHLAPRQVSAAGVKGEVLHYAGPWKTAGEWWAASAWNREEWDVALDDGALYRIYQESTSRDWFVYGTYD